MPIAIYNGKRVQIPFDPAKIAELIFYRGVKVRPDEDANPFMANWQKNQIEDELRKLWGDTTVRAREKTYTQRPSSPAIREDASFSKRIGLPGGTFDEMNVEPNPYLEFPMPKLDSKKLPLFLDLISRGARRI